MRKNTFITMLLLLVLFFAFAVSNFSHAQDKPYPTIVKDYPTLNACQGQSGNVPCKPGDQGFGLPQFIRYIFIFALGSVGIVGLLAVIAAAFDYVLAIGNPQKASNAKDKLLSAFLGILLLLGSYVVLEMINPDLLKLKISAPPINIDTEDNGGGDGETCKITTITWAPTTINTGQSAKLVISLSNKCQSVANITFNDGLALYQELDDTSFYDEWCTNIVRDPQNKLLASKTCTFPNVNNLYTGMPERFYTKGWLKVNGVKSEFTNKPYATVIINDSK